ncbi:MAG: hypothetical protein QOE26_461 [Verrucomicrobiota bacterium]|jgi:hypothetical protein
MNLSALILSITLGILTGFVVNGCTWLFREHLLPAYSDWKYQGMRIDGNWALEHLGTAADGRGLAAASMSATFNQKAHSIRGIATAILEGGGDSANVVTYKVTGEIRDRFVTLYLRATDRGRIAHSSFLLEIVGNGGCMEGCRTFYGLKQRSMRAIECVWYRDHGGSRSTGDCETT